MYKSNVNLNLYKTFYDVATYGSISLAAKKTYSSQPAISKAIKKLETELNVTLFYRTINGVELTSYGKDLFTYVEKSFNNLLTAERRLVEDISLTKGKLSIGMPSNVRSFYLFNNIMEFHQEYPNIEITIMTGSTNKLIELMESHRIDFFIDTEPVSSSNKELIIKDLTDVNYAFIIKKDSQIKDIKKCHSLHDLVDKQLILPVPNTANRLDLDKLLFNEGIEIENVVNIYTSEMIIAAVKQDLGIGYVIENLIDSEIEKLDIQEELPKVTIAICYNEAYLTPASKKFINNYMPDISV